MTRRFAVIAALLLATVPLRATLTIPIDFKTLVNDASLIVRGRVTDVRSVAVPGNGIDSIATFAVENVVKGNANGFVYVRVPGGIIGDRRFVMVGAPAFRVGQRAVLFLRPGTTDTTYRPIGLTQGVYPIQIDPTTHRVIISEPPILAAKTTNASGPVTRGDKRRVPSTVPEFESFVRLAMATPPGAVTNRGAGGK